MSDHDHDHDAAALRAAFSAGVPAPPGASDRAAGARRLARRARRRRTAGVVVAAVVAVASVAVVPGLVGSGGGGSEPRPADASTPSAVALNCPPSGTDAGWDGPELVGSDVVGARLCSDGTTDLAAAIGPDEARRLATLVDGQPFYDVDPVCPAEGGRSYQLVFARTNGSTQVVSGDTGGCGTITVGGVERFGAAEVLDAALAAQPVPDVTCSSAEVPAQGAAPDDLPEGAVVARLCQAPGTDPLDTLTSPRVADVVTLATSRPVSSYGYICDNGAPTYVLVFGYPDGSTRAVQGKPGGCDQLVLGSGVSEGAGAVLDEYVDALREQRSRTSPGDDVPPPDLSCTGERSSFVPVVARPREATEAVLCVDRRDRNKPLTVPVPPGDLRTLLTDAERRGTTAFPRGCPVTTDLTLVGATAWGDRVVLPDFCGSGWVLDGRLHYWSDETRAAIARLTAD